MSDEERAREDGGRTRGTGRGPGRDPDVSRLERRDGRLFLDLKDAEGSGPRWVARVVVHAPRGGRRRRRRRARRRRRRRRARAPRRRRAGPRRGEPRARGRCWPERRARRCSSTTRGGREARPRGARRRATTTYRGGEERFATRGRARGCVRRRRGGGVRAGLGDGRSRARSPTNAREESCLCQQRTGVLSARWTKGERLYAFDPRRVRFERSLDSATPPFQLGGETETRPSRWPARNRVGSERFRRGASSGFATRRVGSVGLDRIARGAFKALDRSRRAGRDRPRALGFPSGFRSPARTLPRALHPLSHPTRRYVLLPEHALRRRGGRLRQARRARRQGPRGPQGVRAHDQGSRQAQQQGFQVALRHQHLPGASRGATARPPERAREAPREATLAPVRRRPRAAFVRARARPGEARPDGASAPDQRTTFSPAPRRRLLFPPFLSSLQLDSSGTSEARRYFRSSDTRRDFLEPPFDRRLRGRLTDASVLLPPFQ